MLKSRRNWYHVATILADWALTPASPDRVWLRNDQWHDRGVTKKIGISLKDELYEWASREVEEGRAESVSALIVEGLTVLEAKSRLTVIAEVWRGTPRQASVGRLVNVGLRRGSPLVIEELTAERARQIGVKIGQTSHPGIVDVHVALAAAERGHAVLTSDDADIAKVNPDLIVVHV
jgi:Arc/MetJ-type ribon-helix-helix transcriptional regulator